MRSVNCLAKIQCRSVQKRRRRWPRLRSISVIGFANGVCIFRVLDVELNALEQRNEQRSSFSYGIAEIVLDKLQMPRSKNIRLAALARWRKLKHSRSLCTLTEHGAAELVGAKRIAKTSPSRNDSVLFVWPSFAVHVREWIVYGILCTSRFRRDEAAQLCHGFLEAKRVPFFGEHHLSICLIACVTVSSRRTVYYLRQCARIRSRNVCGSGYSKWSGFYMCYKPLKNNATSNSREFMLIRNVFVAWLMLEILWHVFVILTHSSLLVEPFGDIYSSCYSCFALASI